jgi:hypothetical protein
MNNLVSLKFRGKERITGVGRLLSSRMTDKVVSDV